MELAEWKEKVRGQRLRDLVFYKIRRQSQAERDLAIEQLMSQVPTNLRGDYEAQLTAYCLLAHAKAFWQIDCAAFADSVVRVFEDKFSKRGEPATADRLFDAFELTVLVLTRSVETSRVVMRASGIGRGRPILWIAGALIVAALLWRWLL